MRLVSTGWIGQAVFSLFAFAGAAVAQPVITVSNAAGLFAHNPAHGVAAGLGGGARIGPLQAAPEISYTRWTGRLIDEEGSRGFYVRSAKNQLDLLLSLTF